MNDRIAATLLSIILASTSALGDEPKKPADPFEGLSFRSIGPSAGGRVSRACGVPGDPFTYYAATAAGGVWKSVDGGFRWKSIFDDQPVSSIGSIAVAPSDPNVVYVGSGEANIRGNVAAGNGIYVSHDAGKTWRHVWKTVGQIGTMVVHPTNADIAYAAVLGNPFGPGENRGVYRTRDGGKTWNKVLYVDEQSGASDVALDPSNPRIIVAGIWQARRRPWELTSGGPGSGLQISLDGGDTWKKLGPIAEPENGLPKGPWGKVNVQVAPSNGRRMYALIEAEDGGLYRSDDGGEQWERVNDNRAIRQRAWYFNTLTVDPTNADVVYFPQVPLLKSADGGKTLQRVKGPHHGDHHDIWIDPRNPKRMIDSNDGGVDVTVDGGETWYAPPLPISQFYHTDCDSSLPFRVGGSMQDIGSMAGPSNSLTDGILISDWEYIGGGEAGHVVFDPANPNVIYAGEYGGYISRFDRRTRQARPVSTFPYNPSGHGAEDLRVRFQWTAPIMVSPHDPRCVYHAGNFLFRTRNGGQSWERISPDLTRNDRNKQRWSGGPITGDNTGVEVYCTIFALAESPKQSGVLWAGSDDGLVHVSRDDGKTWTNVTAAIPGLPDWATIRCIEPSPSEAGTAYLVAEAHRLSDFSPHLWKTTDFGKSWVRLTDALPGDEYLHVIRCDPTKKGLLYVGTERGVQLSRDDGKTWQRLKMKLPTVAVHDLVVKDHSLVVGTMGRSIWIVDDLTPVRQWTPALAKKPQVFAPPPTVRWRTESTPASSFDTSSAGDNPPPGATLTVHLPESVKTATFEVFDSAKNLVAKKSTLIQEPLPPFDIGGYSDEPPKKKPLPTKPGWHRIGWDLRHDGATVIPNAVVDAGNPSTGPLALPGEYTVKLTFDGHVLQTKLTIVGDPRIVETSAPAASPKRPDPLVRLKPEQLAEQHQFEMNLRGDLSRLAETVASLRSVTKQIGERAELLKNESAAQPLLQAGKKLVAKLDALESKLHNPRAKTVYDILAQKGGAKLLSQLAFQYYLALASDGPPTQGMKEVYAESNKELDVLIRQWEAIRDQDVAAFNTHAAKLGVPGTWLPRPAPVKP